MTYAEYLEKLLDLNAQFFGAARFQHGIPLRIQVEIPMKQCGEHGVGLQLCVGFMTDLGDLTSNPF